MKKFMLGSNPITSIVGYVLAALTAAQALLESGETNWGKIAIAAAMAVLGRVSGDSGTKN